MKKSTQYKLENKKVFRAIINNTRTITDATLLDQIKINKEFNSPLTPALLYRYYVSVCNNPSYDLLDDIKVGRQLGYPERTIQKHRLKLAKENWILFEKHKHGDSVYAIWYIGREVVNFVKLNNGEWDTIKAHELGIINDEEFTTCKTLEKESSNPML